MLVGVFLEEFGQIATRVLDGAGQAVFFQVPAGHVAVTADVGWEDGTLAAGGALDITVRIGGQSWFPFDLTGADRRPYVALGDGSVTGGAGDCVPFCGAHARVDDTPFGWRGAGVLRQAGREIVAGPRSMSGLEVTRRAFVPAGGQFVRLLDVL
ncbi:MAG: hypothetical protein DMF81_25280, partial [Acidobacteria bacterium]